jgi:hypothetical protein
MLKARLRKGYLSESLYNNVKLVTILKYTHFASFRPELVATARTTSRLVSSPTALLQTDMNVGF